MGVPVLALAFTAVGLLTIGLPIWLQHRRHLLETRDPCTPCLLYTSDAADE